MASAAAPSWTETGDRLQQLLPLPLPTTTSSGGVVGRAGSCSTSRRGRGGGSKFMKTHHANTGTCETITKQNKH